MTFSFDLDKLLLSLQKKIYFYYIITNLSKSSNNNELYNFSKETLYADHPQRILSRVVRSKFCHGYRERQNG